MPANPANITGPRHNIDNINNIDSLPLVANNNPTWSKWLGTQHLSDESTWETSIFQTTMAQHADLIVPGKNSIEEVDDPQPSQPQNDHHQQDADKAVLRVPQLNRLYKAFQRTSDRQPVVKLCDQKRLTHQRIKHDPVFTTLRAEFKGSRWEEQLALHLPQRIKATRDVVHTKFLLNVLELPDMRAWCQLLLSPLLD